MKKATKRLDMTFHPREELAETTATDIMEFQNNKDRGDGDPHTPKTMTTFQMETALKAELKSFCQQNGTKLGDCINRAVRQFLESEHHI